MKRISRLIFLCAVLALFAAPGWAAEVNVSTAAQLATAVGTAGNVINITDDITLTAQIDINKSVTINGNGHSISGGNTTYRVFNITGGFVEINDLTITGVYVTGNNNNDGGGMYVNKGIVTVTNCTFADNTATGNGGGMCVDTNSTANVTNCTFKDNIAQDNGGGMYVKGTVTVTNCTFKDNTAQGSGGGVGNGGGMYVYSGTATVTNCTFTGNTAQGIGGSGGGMYVYGNGTPTTATATVTNCTFTGNTANATGGGMLVYSKGTATVINCTFVNNTVPNSGAEVYVDSNSSGTLTAINTIFWNDNGNNYVNNKGTMTLTNCAYGSGATSGTITDGGNNVTTLSLSSRTSEKVTVNGVEHTVFRLTASDTKLHTGGTIAAFSTTDQLGVTRSASTPSIGAVEYISGMKISTDVTLPEGTVGTAYSRQLEAAFTPAQTGAELKWSVTSGNLPDGLSLDISGVIAGEPTTAGDYTFTLTAAGSGDVYSIYSANQEFTLKINSSSGNTDVSFDIGTVKITSTGGISDIALELTSRDYLHSAKTSSSDLTSLNTGALIVLSSDQADVVVTIDPGSGDIAAVLCGSENVAVTDNKFTPSTAGTYKIIFTGTDDNGNVKYFAAGFAYLIMDDTDTDDGKGIITSGDVDMDYDGNLVIKPGTTISSDFVNLTGDALVAYVDNFFANSTKLSDSDRATAEDMADFLAAMGVTASDIGDEISGYKIIGAKLGKSISVKRPFIVIMRHADTGRIFLGLGVTQTRSDVFAIKFDILQKAAATVTAEKISFPRGRYIVGATDSEEYLAKSKSEVLSTASEADTAAETEEIGSIYLGEFELAAANYTQDDTPSGDDDTDTDDEPEVEPEAILETSRHGSSGGCNAAGFDLFALAALALAYRKFSK